MVERFDVQWKFGAVDAIAEGIKRYPWEAVQTQGSRLQDLCSYWLSGYNVDVALDDLNKYPHFIAPIEGAQVHFVHVVGEARGRRPLLMLHGWPGSFYEYWTVIEHLAFPSKHGGQPSDAYDLVIPSLPGFGFSTRGSSPTGPRATARVFEILMREVLGYSSYHVQGSDWGAGVAAWLGIDTPVSLKAIHLDYLLTRPRSEPSTAKEVSWKRIYDECQEQIGAYSRLQETRPLSLVLATAGNPVGQFAWILERYEEWADLRDRSFEEVFTRDQLITTAMLYIATDAFATSVQYYADAEEEGARFTPEGTRVMVPTSFSGYPSPAFPYPPREWVERVYNLVDYRKMPRGGHFPAMEVPDLFVEDLREWGRRF